MIGEQTKEFIRSEKFTPGIGKINEGTKVPGNEKSLAGATSWSVANAIRLKAFRQPRPTVQTTSQMSTHPDLS